MLGVDFVIRALFETFGLRWDGDWALAFFAPTASKTKATKEKINDFTALILLRSAECKAAKHCRSPKRGRDCECIFLACILECGGAPPLFGLSFSASLFHLFEQLLFQMTAHRFFDRAPLSCHSFFLRLALSSRPALYGTWQVRNLRSLRTDFSFLWFRVRIHEQNASASYSR